MSRLFANLIRRGRAYWAGTLAMLSTLGTLYASRFWLLLYLLGGLLLLVGGLPLIAGIGGQFFPRPDMLSSYYGGLAEQESRQLEAEQMTNNGAAQQPIDQLLRQRTTPYGNLLYRRLLQVEEGASSARFTLALAVARENKIPQARQQMQQLAPEAGGGFPPAHAWLAIDLLGRIGELDDAQRKTLLKHLEEADKWEDCNPALRAAYADLLAKSGDKVKAVEVLERASKQDPKLTVALSAMAAEAGMTEKAAEVSGSLEDELEARIKSDTPKVEDIAQLASLMLLKGDTNRCLELVEQGNQIEPGNPSLRRLNSNALLVEFRKTVNQKADGLELNLDLLDAALKADPTNPDLSNDLARAINLGLQLPAEMNEKLEEYLASGRASGLLHLMIANQQIIKGEIAAALPHLEISDRLAPKSPVIMNNLALALALTDKSKIERALGLISEAIQIAGEQPDLMDTLGQINLIAQRPLDAIACFEKVLAVKPDSIETRKMLAEAYKAAGMESLAKKQLEQVEALGKGGK